MNAPIQNFGRVDRHVPRASILPREALGIFKSNNATARGFLPYGNGRSYGDSCLTRDGLHIDMRVMNRIVSLDLKSGILTAEPGIILGDLIKQLQDTGWFPPVVPGTQFVTLGGALANDIHGKNHHGRGTFGAHVLSFKLARSDGSVTVCSRSENPDLFAATIGGIGLTGIIIELTLQLAKVSAHSIRQRTIPFGSLDGYFDLIESEGENHEYAVAWIDQLATGKKFGHGLMLLGDHAAEELPAKNSLKLGVLFQPPINMLNGLSLKLFNTAYNWAGSRKTGDQIVSAQSFFFPLDAVKNWNRLYGPRGLYQHQSVIPLNAARAIIRVRLRF
jgi:FAD/FMN-containing dehydrogenase